MLDKRNIKFLTKLNKLCNNNYKVFEKQELEELSGMKGDSLKTDIDFLAERQYIDIKYDDENVICLNVLPKAFSVVEKEQDSDLLQKKITKIMFFTCLFSAISAFLGSFVAMLIIK